MKITFELKDEQVRIIDKENGKAIGRIFSPAGKCHSDLRI